MVTQQAKQQSLLFDLFKVFDLLQNIQISFPSKNLFTFMRAQHSLSYLLKWVPYLNVLFCIDPIQYNIKILLAGEINYIVNMNHLSLLFSSVQYEYFRNTIYDYYMTKKSSLELYSVLVLRIKLLNDTIKNICCFK